MKTHLFSRHATTNDEMAPGQQYGTAGSPNEYGSAGAYGAPGQSPVNAPGQYGGPANAPVQPPANAPGQYGTPAGTPAGYGAPAEYGAQEMGTTSRVVSRPSWSPSQLFAVAAGLLGTVFGAIALARTGTDFSNLASTHAQVAGMGFSALSAVVQLGVGIVLLAMGMGPYAARVGCGLFGAAALVWGIVIVADTARLFANWGYNNATGVVYIVAGAVLLLVAIVSPVFSSTRREVRTSSGRHVERV